MPRPVYFSLDEFIRSDTAKRKGINNTPSWEVVENLQRLALFLDDLRRAWGSGIRITSGFRCVRLNSEVGGVANSAHLTGNACDMVPVNGDLAGFEKFLKEYLVGKDYNQVIWESVKGKRWVHFGLFNNKGEQRHKVFGITVG